MKIVIAALFFTVILTSPKELSAYEQPDTSGKYQKLVSKGFLFIYNNEFKQADSTATSLLTNYPKNPTSHFFYVNYYWWKILTGDDTKEVRKKFITGILIEKKILDKKEKKSLSYEDIFNYMNVYAYQARMDLINNNYIRAVSHVDKCIGYLKLSFQHENKYDAFYLTSGLYHYFISRAHSHYPFLYPYLIFLPPSNLEKGFQYLVKCTALNNVVLQTEANYFLMKIYYEEEKEYKKAIPYAEWLSKTYPKNILYNYMYLKILLNLNEKNAVEKQFQKLIIQTAQNDELTENQKKHYINFAKKDMENYYKELSSEKQK